MGDRSEWMHRNPRIANLIPLIEVTKPKLALEANHLKAVHETLEAKGVVQLALGFSDETSSYLQTLITNLHKSHDHGLPITHSAERGWFWDVRPSPSSFQSHGHQARSETMFRFDWHTDCSYEECPPRFFALQVIQPDRCGGGTLSVLNVDQLLALLSPFAQEWLSSNNYRITVPQEFIKNQEKQYIVDSLLAIRAELEGGSQLRFRDDITTPLTPNAAKALEELKTILYGNKAEEWTIHLEPKSLPRGSILLMDNRRWLHSRNEVKDPNRHLRRQVYFPDGVDFSFVSSEEPDADTVTKVRATYIARLKACSSSWPAGSLDASCPHPVLITERHHEELSELHCALNLAIENIIERWWSDEKAQFPQRMPLEPGEEDLLRWIDSNPSLFRPWNERQGSWRPDFLVEFDEAGLEAFRICEINARFCFNGFMHGGFGQTSLSEFDLESRGLVHCVDGESIPRGLLNLFDNKLPLHLIKGDEHGIDIFMFIEFIKKRLGIKPRLITPETLRIIPDLSSSSEFKLCCLAQVGATDTMTTDTGEIVEEIHQVGLELHQREINALDPEIRRQISVRCFNDMRTILLAHDKRMLGLVREELETLVYEKTITLEQAERLRRGITPTILPGSAGLDQFIIACKAEENLHKGYILKPIRGGKGAGILFGDELASSQWLALLEQMQSPKLEKGKTLYVVQRQINQPRYDVVLTEGKSQRCHMVGTYHAANGEYLGLGTWRCSPGRLCAVSDGATWICSVKENRSIPN
ncbi:hypothetical protein N7528_009326 [Penicillium herquei]|nr:hypothetical protein N7528_009326 [Penicillium herquei]